MLGVLPDTLIYISGCHELLLSLGLDVVEITEDKVLLFGGNNDAMREFHSCMSQLLAQR